MKPLRFLIITSALLGSGLVPTVSPAQNVNAQRFSNDDLNDPWSLTPWSLESSSLILFRSDPSSNELIEGIGNPSNSVNADDLSYGTAYGFQLQLERQLTQRTRFEARYFGTDDFSENASQATTPNQLFDPQLLDVGLPLPRLAGTSIQSRLASKLYSAELNMNHEVTENIEAIAGFRYVRLKDSLSLNIPDAETPLLGFPVPTSLESEASNDLFGAQLGARARLWSSSRFSLSTDFKGGVYGNGARQGSSITTTLPLLGDTVAFANDRDDTVAFVGEWTLQGNYRLTDRWSVDIGYQLLWIDGVAVGTEQLAASNYSLPIVGGPGNGIDSHDHVFYQGIMLGVDYVW